MEKWYIGYTTVALAALLSTFGGYKGFQAIQKIDACKIECASLLSESAEQYVAQNVCLLLNHSPSYVVAQLQKEYPHLRAISVERRPTGVMHVCVDAHKPVAKINTAVATECGVIAKADWYQQQVINNLPNITMKQIPLVGTIIDQEFVVWAKQLPDNAANQYAIMWKSPTNIVLQHKTHKDIDLVVCAEQKWNNKFKKQLAVAEQKCLAARTKARKKGPWVADMRFNNQIIVAQRGTKNGANTT